MDFFVFLIETLCLFHLTIINHWNLGRITSLYFLIWTLILYMNSWYEIRVGHSIDITWNLLWTDCQTEVGFYRWRVAESDQETELDFYYTILTAFKIFDWMNGLVYRFNVSFNFHSAMKLWFYLRNWTFDWKDRGRVFSLVGNWNWNVKWISISYIIK